MNRLPNWSKDRLGSQQASPRLSLLPISFVDQVLPPSKLTPSNMPAFSPASLCPTLVTMTMFLGFVGLTAIDSSDSLRCRWLTSTLVGVPRTVAVAVATGTAAKAATISKTPPDSLRMGSSFSLVAGELRVYCAPGSDRKCFRTPNRLLEPVAVSHDEFEDASANAISER